MADSLLINTYSGRTSQAVLSLIGKYFKNTWLEEYGDQIFQICDELIKNAVKSNYKFLLLWYFTRKRMLEQNLEMTSQDADEWLREVFFSGESVLLEKQMEKLSNRATISESVRKLLDIENRYMTIRAQQHPRDGKKMTWEKVFIPLLRIKRLARKLKVHIHFRIESSVDQVLITVANDAPILDEDMVRISSIRRKFAEYVSQGKHQDFFVENLDTTGGGHGLGYAIMDAILLDLALVPEVSLYLIGASRTMVLLALPLKKPAEI